MCSKVFKMRLMYITSENFTNELISAIQQNRNVEFRNRFRNVDILMVDDIQFIAGRIPPRKNSSTPSTPCTPRASRS